MEHKGKLIVIEGTDGSGKDTQTKLLVGRLKQDGNKTLTFSFPQYGKKSAGLIEEYLNGTYGAPDDVNPYAASLFYALNRFDLAPQIKKALSEGNTVVLDRYVDSNAGHQGGKIKSQEKREKFLAWLYDIEYRILEIPQPDLVLILHVPAEISRRLIAERNLMLKLKHEGKDIHEADLEHLKNTEASYRWLAKQHPRDHIVIECASENSMLPPGIIHERVWDAVETVL